MREMSNIPSQHRHLISLSSMSRPSLHTPPMLPERSYIAEQESYGAPRVSLETLTGKESTNSKDDIVDDYTPETIKKEDNTSTVASNKDQISSNSNDNRSNSETRLPTRLAHYIDLFLHSLQEPKYMTPLTGDNIADLYQEFYTKFASKAEDYLVGKNACVSGSTPGQSGNNNAAELAMSSFEEMADKKHERAVRAAKLKTLAELGEQRVCSVVYDKVFFVSHGDDLTNDEVMQQKIKILKRLPITLVDLGLTGYSTEKGSCVDEIVTKSMREWIKLNQARSPRTKLNYLLNIHRIIVDTLSQNDQPGNSSADAILPFFIYAMIMSGAPHVYLNLKFIYRFRNVNFLNGEALYCMTNFEAAVAFLQAASAESLGIDLSALPSDLDVSCLMINHNSATLNSGSCSPRSTSTHRHKNSVTSAGSRSSRSNSLNKEPGRGRRVSLLSLSHNSSDFASSAADMSIKSIGSTFGSSYRYLMGKFTDKKDTDLTENGKYPNTLEEARKVVGLEPYSSPETIGSTEDTINAGIPSPSRPEETGLTVNSNSVRSSSIPDLARVLGASEKRSSQISQSSSIGESGSMLGKWTGGMMKNFRSSSFSASVAAHSSPIIPNTKFLTTDFENLKMSELRELHLEYKKLAQYVKTFEQGP